MFPWHGDNGPWFQATSLALRPCLLLQSKEPWDLQVWRYPKDPQTPV